MALVPVILSGGAGTRLWPLSRELYPKQLLALMARDTLLQATVRRLKGLEAGAPTIVCNEAHRFLVAEQLRAIDCVPRGIVLEPASSADMCGSTLIERPSLEIVYDTV